MISRCGAVGKAVVAPGRANRNRVDSRHSKAHFGIQYGI
jgi:hypothetical protein